MIRLLPRRLREGSTALVARGAGIVFIAQAIGAGLSFLLHVLLARWAGAPGYGAYSYALAWISLLSIGAGIGFPEITVRFLPEYETSRSWSLMRGLIRRGTHLVTISSFVVAVTGTAVITGWLGIPSEDSQRALLIGLWILPFYTLMRLHTQMCRATNRIVAAYMAPRVLRPLLMIGGLFLLTQVTNVPLSGAQAILFLGAAFALTTLVQRVDLTRNLPTKVHAVDASYSTRQWLHVSTPFLLISGFVMALQQTDLIVVGMILNAEAAGLYKAAATIATPAGFVLAAVTATAAPQFARLYTNDERKRLQELVTTMAHWLFWPTLGIAAGIGLIAHFLLDLFGPDFAAAYVPALILLLSHLINAGLGAVGYLLNMTDHHTDSARVYGLSAVLNLGLTVGGTYLFGLVGAAAATTLSMLLWNTWLHYITSQRLNLSPSILFALSPARE